MLRFYSVTDSTNDYITFISEEIENDNKVVYLCYDTSTGIIGQDDYYAWRTTTTQVTSSTGIITYPFRIDNTRIFPTFSNTPYLYSDLDLSTLHIISSNEYWVLNSIITRLDTVRRRFPNVGPLITDGDGIGEGGAVGFGGGFDKKFSIKELLNFMEGALIEINIHPPATNYWWAYVDADSERKSNPYNRNSGVPFSLLDLVVQGAIIRALTAWGLLEVDLNFNTTDAGLQISYDRVNHVASWMGTLLNEYKAQKDFIKYDSVNSYGVGVGTYPYSALGIYGTAMNMISHNGSIPFTSLLGFSTKGYTPL